MNLREWAKFHTEKPEDATIHEILMNKRSFIDVLVDILSCTRWKAALIVYKAQQEGYKF